MTSWLAAAISAPALLVAAVFPGFPGWSGSQVQRPLPAEVHHAIAAADLPTTSPGTATFNDPYGPSRRQYALIRHIDAKIAAAPAGSEVRLAAYSFAMPVTAATLVAAEKRGVSVKVVVDDHSAKWKAVQTLVDELGTDVGADSYVRICHRSCRGGSGNQHAKFVTLSQSGRAHDVVMVGSMNFTTYAASRQWQDLYTTAEDTELYRQLVEVFSLMTRDRPQGRLALPGAGQGFQLEAAPLPGYAARNDPVLERLRRVHCQGASAGRTRLWISMHAWNGDRGLDLARQVARLSRQGCEVKVLAGVGFGPQVTRVLRASRVDYRDSRRRGRATHEKLMFLSGRYGADRNANLVWTGSHNWSDRSLRNDEVTLRVAGARLVSAYRANFAKIWRVAGRR